MYLDVVASQACEDGRSITTICLILDYSEFWGQPKYLPTPMEGQYTLTELAGENDFLYISGLSSVFYSVAPSLSPCTGWGFGAPTAMVVVNSLTATTVSTLYSVPPRTSLTPEVPSSSLAVNIRFTNEEPGSSGDQSFVPVDPGPYNAGPPPQNGPAYSSASQPSSTSASSQSTNQPEAEGRHSQEQQQPPGVSSSQAHSDENIIIAPNADASITLAANAATHAVVATLTAAVFTIQGNQFTYRSGDAVLRLDSTTITRGGAPATVGGSVVSLGTEGVVVGPSTIPLTTIIETSRQPTPSTRPSPGLTNDGGGSRLGLGWLVGLVAALVTLFNILDLL